MNKGCHLFYKAIVSYDGTDYKGWQHQSHKMSVADRLEEAFNQAFKQKITIKGASRTDAGVHALGQHISFASTVALCPDRLRTIWNNNLTSSINIISLTRTQELFNPRDGVILKEYCYTIFTHRPSIQHYRFGYFTKCSIDHGLFKQALALFVGTHDFASFCKPPQKGGTIRTVESIDCYYDSTNCSYSVLVRGKSFLHNMIRRMVGAALQVAQQQKTLHSIIHAISSPHPMQEFLNAPACGLMLRSIIYESKDKE